LSDRGTRRENNEDAVGAVLPTEASVRDRKGCLCAIADGLGGHAAGHVASATALQTLFDEYFAPTTSSRVEQALGHAMQTANLRVHDLSQQCAEYRSMATTLTAIALVGSTAYLAHVGDSRVYHLRGGHGGAFAQLTQDHSEVAQLVRMRLVKPEMARQHPGRNVLTRVLGHQLMLRPDFSRLPIGVGDAFVLCTDGVWSELTDAELAEMLHAGRPAAESCRNIIDRCLERGCQDNASVEVLRIVATGPSAAPAEGSRLGGLFRIRR
ncbi:MAG: PP2C family protein-serine/threonine phosphatase, partial [Chloroflexota bacterium]